ncbi:MAG: hypothetical protein ACRDHW_23745, partial [Ktedonobacteraceae bacterium]
MPRITISYMPKPITAIIVSVDYGDYLALSLPYNKGFFSKVIVVTAPDDITTRSVCEQNQVEMIQSTCFWERQAPFNKAAGLNLALKAAKTSYICALDADVLLPCEAAPALDTIGAEYL